VTDQSLRSCLHYLAEGGHSHCGGGRGGGCGRAGEEAAAEAGVRLLLLYGAQADDGDMSGHTPLHLAAASSHVGVVKLLLGLGGADTSVRDREGMLALRLAKGREVKAMLQAAGYQAYCLKKLRCVVGMMVGTEGGEEGGGEEGQDGGRDGGKETEEGEGEAGLGVPSSSSSSSSLPKRTESQILTAAEEVRHSVMRRREAVEQSRPMPRVEFHHTDTEEEGGSRSSSSSSSTYKSGTLGVKMLSLTPFPHSSVPPADLPARVLEEAVRTMNGDLFFELLDLLWPWSVTS